MLTDLDPLGVRARLQTARLGRSMRLLEVSDSTNDDARADALAGAPAGHVVVADSQRRGRGSHGRTWTSPAGEDLYVSIVERPELALAQLPPLTLAVGIGVAEAVERLLAPLADPIEVKWPNDVRIGGRKCAGILVEASSMGDQLGPLVIGIGLNVNRSDWPDDLRETATSMQLARPGAGRIDRAQVLAEVLLCIERWIDRFIHEGEAALIPALEHRLAMRGERVRCGDVTGRLLGVGPTGALRIATATGPKEVFAGRLERAT